MMRNRYVSLLILLYGLIGWVLPAAAVRWHDDFDTAKPDVWRAVGNNAIWKVKDGFLRAEMKREWNTEYELYQFTALPPPYRNFIVQINHLGSDKTRFGFCIGRRFPDTPGEDPFFYVFFPDEIRARRFNGKGSSHPFRFRLSREPRVRWETGHLTRMEVYFDAGYFVVLVDGEFRTAFRDANFDEVEILGFVMEGINIANEWVGEGWADSFTISGLEVTAEVRLTSLWADLKQ